MTTEFKKRLISSIFLIPICILLIFEGSILFNFFYVFLSRRASRRDDAIAFLSRSHSVQDPPSSALPAAVICCDFK